MKKQIAIGFAALAISASSAGMAYGATANVDGGTWNYGAAGDKVWSDYYHPGARHGSTAVGKFTANSGCVNPKVWSKASAPKALWGNQSYYRKC